LIVKKLAEILESTYIYLANRFLLLKSNRKELNTQMLRWLQEKTNSIKEQIPLSALDERGIEKIGCL
jgi:hypothetical protein